MVVMAYFLLMMVISDAISWIDDGTRVVFIMIIGASLVQERWYMCQHNMWTFYCYFQDIFWDFCGLTFQVTVAELL